MTEKPIEHQTGSGSAEAGLLSEIVEAVGTIAELQGKAFARGQHVVASKLECARDELMAAVGCWNYAISDNASVEGPAGSATMPKPTNSAL